MATEPSTTDLAIAAGRTLLPLAGPYGLLADAALTAGLQFWAAFSAKKTEGTLTMEDLEAAAAKTGQSLDAFRKRVEGL